MANWGEVATPHQGPVGGLRVIDGHRDVRQGAHRAYLVLVEQSGAKWEIAQPSASTGILEAEQAMRCHGSHLREVKVISRNKAVARWKADKLRWRRMA